MADTDVDPITTSARDMAQRHQLEGLTRRADPIPAWLRLRQMKPWLSQAVAAAAAAESRNASAAEWLLDNDYEVQRAIFQIEEDLPDGFYARLSGIGGTDKPWPRIYDLAHGLLDASRLQISLSASVHFVTAYQDRMPLTIAELWAFPTMLRIACIELLVSGFGVLFDTVAPPFPTAKSGLSCLPSDPTECVARAIANLGVIAGIPWKDFFDRTSRVEAILRQDPADVYARMDFETRDRYRHAIERIAGRSHANEWEVAERAVSQAREHHRSPLDHVGYWLIGEGREQFEREIDVRHPWPDQIRQALGHYPAQLYVTALLLVGLTTLALPALYLHQLGASPYMLAAGIGLSTLSASMLSVSLVNWVVTLLVPPRVLPKLDFYESIAPDCATAVIMPVILAHGSDAEAALNRLEGHYLANPDPLLQFTLLSDVTDADREYCLEDAEIEHALITGIDELNARHGSAGLGPFRLLHRHRQFNPAQGCWMGWERKRGKIEQFNQFVLTGNRGVFPLTAGNVDALCTIRFVVTADADTRLPPGVVNRLVGTLAHPLNRAHFDEESGRVTLGYTILQPRVEIAPDVERQSWFTRFFGGDTAIDIYSRAVSDVYQDLFGSGSFIGKGIYEVASFARSLAGVVPENCLLSHDLFEGLHGRTALASDTVVFEGFPDGYLDHARRWHRWVRGDWQVMPWLFPIVPGCEGTSRRNRLNWFDRLKILDNLRRSLCPIATFALLLGGWLFLPGNPLAWTLLAVAAPGIFLITDLVASLASGGHRGAMRSSARRLVDHVGRWMLALVFLVSDAAIATHAITITLGRMARRKRLLEWTSAAHVARLYSSRRPRQAAWQELRVSPLCALILVGAIALIRPSALPAAAPLLLLWLAAPEIAVWITRPLRPPVERIEAADRAFLRKVARRTWLYFETFVRPDDNWLPPDNYQEPPVEEIAHRTSPTNIGVMLLAALTAWKLGHIGLNDLATRIRNTLNTLDRLDRHRGHILNWYDTRTLKPLEPRYVSTVDSGNLMASLLLLSAAFREAQSTPPFSPVDREGLLDEFALVDDALAGLAAAGQTRDIITRMRDLVGGPTGPMERHELLRVLEVELLPALRTAIQDMIASGSLPARHAREVRQWIERLGHHLHSMRRDEKIFRPWLAQLARAPAGLKAEAALLATRLGHDIPLNEVEAACRAAHAVAVAWPAANGSDEAHWRQDLLSALDAGTKANVHLRNMLGELAERAAEWAHRMEFGFLFDPSRRLFHIGYNVSADRIDQHHYDLLASEARLASYLAIAKGDVPLEHWFYLGRPVTRQSSGLALVSWNGSMFEYLMPSLFMRSDPRTLLGLSDRTAIDMQRAYADQHGTPWGVSESSFASMGSDRAYRYHAFGVPGLGLRRGLERDHVIAPYASLLALAVRSTVAIRNLRRLADLGMIGRYGFFEALDYTPGRAAANGEPAIVHSYMVHHHGMSLAAIGNALCNDMLVRWFHADPHVQTVELLLNERIPWELPPELARHTVRETIATPATSVPGLHPWAPSTYAHCLHAVGNGRMTTRFGAGGTGLYWQGHAMAVSPAGPWLHVRESNTGTSWDATPDLTALPADDTRVVLHAERVECHRRDNELSITTEISVAHADDVEIRRVTLVNDQNHPRHVDLTSFAEVVLAPIREAARHPAFSKMFVHAERVPGLDALLFTRRPRSPEQSPPVLLHRVIADHENVILRGFETDREAFIGRLGNAVEPAALLADRLKGTTGWTLDPVMALQVAIDIPPGGRREIAFVTIAAPSRATALEIAERYASLPALQWAMNDAATETARDMHRLGLMPPMVPQAARLLGLMAGPDIERVPFPPVGSPRPARPDMWSLGISGDNPILLLRARDGRDAQLLRFLVPAQRFCNVRGIPFDIVVLHEGEEGYVDPVRARLLDALRELGAQDRIGQRAGIHLIGYPQISDEVARMLERAARLILDEFGLPFDDQLDRSRAPPTPSPRFAPIGVMAEDPPTPEIPRRDDLLHDNGIGGFAPEDGSYVIQLPAGITTPAPWANVLANSSFGTIVTEAGLGYSWSVNAGENRITPWSNDPVRDPQTEAIYLRDEENAHLWSVSPAPMGDAAACRVTHAAGETRWERWSEGLEQEMLVFVPPDAPVKLVRLRLRNLRPRMRRITATYHAQWLLGTVADEGACVRSSVYDPSLHAILGFNPWTESFTQRVAFLTATEPPHSLTSSTAEFLGPEGRPDRPAALRNSDLGGRLQAVGEDCCASYQVHLGIPPGESVDVIFILGQGDDHAHVKELVERWRDPIAVENARQACTAEWQHRLGAITVRSPDSDFDLLVNRWLPYQALSSRIRARAGFYQAGGAFGFRDQLQDVLAFRFADPGLVRHHILEAASHQFEEGDVLHWWHPPAGAGVRTRCSDDMLWLPYVVGAYVDATGDHSILEEMVPFLHAAQLAPHENDRYALFEQGRTPHTLFEHCERALERAYRLGWHGLPLIGSGDWNDGMDRIGAEGRGESIWLGWFLISAIHAFAPLCATEHRPERAVRWLRRAAELTEALDKAGWDGDWYLRAFADDRRPWGTKNDSECQIDSISQSWAQISGAGRLDRVTRALASAREHLLRTDDTIVRLLDPPFHHTARDPGYIKAYPPGIRENGGQYTHAAAWLGIALAQSGEGDAAMEVFRRINPIRQSRTREGMHRYRTEPYVLAGDVGGIAPHVGRGGWSWYTGAASWTWRLGVEHILGLTIVNKRLRIAPCLPSDWPWAEAELHHPEGTIHVRIENVEGTYRSAPDILVDHLPWLEGDIAFPTDGTTREVLIKLTHPPSDTA